MNDIEIHSQAIKDAIPEIAKEVAQILSSTESSKTEEKTSDVFVIISFYQDMDPIFDGMKAAGEQNGLQVDRVKDVVGDYRITDQIITMIKKSKFVVADLTHERPNVYFELGYARGLGKKVITTAREGTKIHFDVNGWPCIYYNDSRVLEKILGERFCQELCNA